MYVGLPGCRVSGRECAERADVDFADGRPVGSLHVLVGLVEPGEALLAGDAVKALLDVPAGKVGHRVAVEEVFPPALFICNQW